MQNLADYRIVPFHAFDKYGKAIYHTNVLMCIGEKFSVIYIDSITNPQEKETVLKCLADSGKELTEINLEQMSRFAGNMLEVKSKHGKDLLVMSEQAFKALSDTQIEKLSTYCKILHSPLYTIESNGGGSARCMMAEVYLENK